jgi:hypothetical protein
MDFANLELINILIVLVACAVFVILVVVLLPYVKRKQGYPYEAKIEGFVVPLLVQAVGAVFAVLMAALVELDARFAKLDIANLAGILYDKLAAIDELKFVTYIVTRSAFIERVVAGAEWADKQFDLRRDELADLFNDWQGK